jgi:hypothetical protein
MFYKQSYIGLHDTTVFTTGNCTMRTVSFKAYHVYSFGYQYNRYDIIFIDIVKQVMFLAWFLGDDGIQRTRYVRLGLSWKRVWKWLQPNFVAEWSTLLFRILQRLSLILCPETGYPDWVFWWFSSVFPAKFRGSTLNKDTITSSQIVSNSSFANHPFTRRYVVLSYWKGAGK